jgi:hypothetical protein
LAALSAIETAAVRVPPFVGVKTKLIEQLLPGAIEPVQVLALNGENAKSVAFVPVMVLLAMFSAPVPEFVSVTLRAALVVPTVWLPKSILFADSVTTGAVPVPFTATAWGLPAASSAMVTVAVRLPVVTGANFTENEQVVPAATDAPVQLFALSTKSAGFEPPIVSVPMCSVAVPVLLTVTV